MAKAANGKTAEKEQQGPRMQVLGQYIRDMSFENMAMQKDVKFSAQPDLQVQVNLDARKKPEEHQYEVLTKLKVEAKSGEELVFLLELEYGGLFHIENVPDDQMHPFLLIECPRMLFPFLRRIVGDITRDGGFPPLNLDNIDFVALYRQEMARVAAAKQESGEDKPAS